MTRNYRSNLTPGTALWAGRRAHWRALGLTDEDMAKPKIAIINSSSELAICFSHLDGVAAEPELNLGDGMHPNEEGIEVVVDRIFPAVEKLIARAREKAAPAGETAKEITHKDGEG